MDKVKPEKFWNWTPLSLPRICAWALLWLLVLASFNILGLHEPPPVISEILASLAWIILTICRAAEYIISEIRGARND